MAEEPKNEWADMAWNPIRGCARVSPGCKHCYAEAYANRWIGVQGHPYEFGFAPRLASERLLDPLRWTRSRRVAVCSLSDAFHSGIPPVYHSRMFEVMAAADWHVFQVLSKRARRMRQVVRSRFAQAPEHGHIWFGVSVEDRRRAAERIQLLRETPAAKRFVVFEPLLQDLGELDLADIDWVLVGGETGPGARPLEREWVARILQQCRAAQIPFYYKQGSAKQLKLASRRHAGRLYHGRPRFRPRPVPSRGERERRKGEIEWPVAFRF